MCAHVAYTHCVFKELKQFSMAGISKAIVIPPSPNWYLSSDFECHKKSGVLAYAASRCLVLVKPQEGDVGFPTTRVIPDAHRYKITCQ